MAGFFVVYGAGDLRELGRRLHCVQAVLRYRDARQRIVMATYPVLIPLAPLIASLLIAGLGRVIGWKVSRLGVVAQLIALALSIQALRDVVGHGPISVTLSLFPPPFDLGLYIDRLSAVMLVHISAIGLVIHLFSVRFMQQERGYFRYHALLALAGFVLLCMVSSANLLMLFIFWQFLSWLVYLLSYHYTHPATVEGAFKTLAVLRLGDFAFLAGVLLAHALYGTLDFQQLFERASATPIALSLGGGGLEISAVTVITLLLFIGAMTKSVQLPMQVWLPSSLYAPTPIHALLHAGIINAGGFLINRLAPLYGLAPDTLHLAFVIGGLTALTGASIMLTQPDIKRMLGFSTIGQMGYMIMECGLGAFALAIFHLIAHGLFKATVFLSCSNVIHDARREPHFPPGYVLEEHEHSPNPPWATGVIVTLLLPLIILLIAHGIVQVPLRDAQGAVIFLFFAWVTSSQAILSLYRLRAIGSWKIAAVMVLTIFLVMVTYLWAAESFTYFLYPAPGEAGHYFQVAAFPLWVFDAFIVTVTLAVVAGWVVVYRNIQGEQVLVPQWIVRRMPHLYLLCWNQAYMDVLYARMGRALSRLARRLDAALPEWLP